MNAIVVPWRTPDQFLKVYEYAYSEDLAKKRWAVDQMNVWETRCWPALPLHIEATLFMVRANVQDMLFEADKSFCSAGEIEMMYCTAVIRFINLVLERENNEDQHKILYELAEEKNIPGWIVEIRHRATHGFCPTLPVLRMAHKTIMESLECMYWIPKSRKISLWQKTFRNNKFVEILQEYRTVQHQNIKSTEGDSLVDKALQVILKKLRSLLNDDETRYHYLQLLVHPDYFVTKGDINCLNENDKKSLIEENSGVLPKPFKTFWNPILLVLHRFSCVPLFLELLLLSQENRNIKVFQKVADYLVLHVLNQRSTPTEGGKLRKAFVKKGPIFNYFRLLYACMKGSSDSSKLVIDKLSTFIPLGGWTEELCAMLSIKRGLTVIKEMNNKGKMSDKGQKRKFDITFTVEDLEEDIHAEMANRNPNLKKNPWTLAPINMDFSNILLGHVFNPVEKENKEEKRKIEVVDKKPIIDSLMVPQKTEESMAIEAHKPPNFIFQRLPAQSCMIYRRRNKK